MLTYHSFFRSVSGYNAFPSDAAFKEAAADVFFALGDSITADYEKLGKEVTAEASEDALSISANGKTYLLNRQTPSRQIWVASPLSGSLKFNYDNELDQWVDHKDPDLELSAVLHKDIDAVMG